MYLKSLFSLFLASFFTHSAFAASCCTGGGGQSVCVLPAEQIYQLGFATRYREVKGQFDPYGEYQRNSQATSSQQITTTVGGAIRINEDWQSSLSIPFINNRLKTSSGSGSATVLGDPAIEARYTWFEDLAFLKYRPEIAFFGGARLPFGRTVDQSRDPYNLDAVGEGATTLHLGVSATKLYRPIRLTLEGAFFVPFSRHVEKSKNNSIDQPYDFRSGDRFEASQSIAYLLGMKWSVSLGLKQIWVNESEINGASQLGSAERIFSSLAGVHYFPSDSVNLGLNYETNYPFYSYEANAPFSESVSLNLSYAGF